jgi:hypothetical protein
VSLLDYGVITQKTPERVWLEVGMERYADACRQGRIIAAKLKYVTDLTDEEIRDIVSDVRSLVRQVRLVEKVLNDTEKVMLRNSPREMTKYPGPDSMLVKGGK